MVGMGPGVAGSNERHCWTVHAAGKHGACCLQRSPRSCCHCYPIPQPHPLHPPLLNRVPEALIPPAGARVMSLQDGTSKMSKSAESDLSRINLLDSPDLIVQKVKVRMHW